MENKVIITVAPTGAYGTKKENPYLPIHPEEIADEVFACYQAGASIAHIHVRDDEGQGTMNFEKFEKTVKLIRERCDIVLNLTTSGSINAQDEERVKPFMMLRPELASFDCGSINWGQLGIFQNSPQFLTMLGQKMKECKVKPEIEIFDTGMLHNAQYYLKSGVLESPPHFQFVLGVAGGMPATIENLVYLKNLLPNNATWSAFGVGKMNLPILLATVALGGHIRVGMEDNHYFAKGILAKSNVEFVERAKRIIKEAGKEVASPDEARSLLKIQSYIRN